MNSTIKTAARVAVLGLSVALASGSALATTTIEFFNNKPENIDTYKKLIAAFEAANPDIKVTFSSPPQADTVLKTRIVKNKIPDVMSMGGSAQYRTFVDTGVLKDYSADPLLKNVQPAYIKMLAKILDDPKAKTYGIPYAANANGLIYNADKLKQLGLKPPKTWNEFIADLDKAKAAGQTPIYFTLKDAWTGLVAMNAIAGDLEGDNFASLKNKGQATFAKSYSEVADKMLKLMNYGHKDNFGVGYSDGNVAFGKGSSVFYIQGIWAIPDIMKANPKINIGVIPFPVTNDAAKNKIVSGVDVLLTSFKDTPHPVEAQKLIAFLLDPKNVAIYVREQNAFPTLRGIVQQDPKLTGLRPAFASGSIASFPDHFYPAGLSAENFVQAFLQDKNKTKFLAALDSEWDKILKRQ